MAGALVFAIGLAACGGGGSSEPPVTMRPTLASIQAEVFTPTCATSGCHSAAQREGGLSLEPDDSLRGLLGIKPSNHDAQLEGMMRVDPGNPDNSYLVEKLRKGLPLNKGRRMPYQGKFLGNAEIDVIAEWIANGAQP